MKKILLTAVAAVFLTVAFAFTNTTKDVDDTVNTTKIKTTTLINTYKVVTGDTPSKLQYEAVRALASGYQFQGGVSYADGVYAQALVR